jgi:hypothetical protein
LLVALSLLFIAGVVNATLSNEPREYRPNDSSQEVAFKRASADTNNYRAEMQVHRWLEHGRGNYGNPRMEIKRYSKNGGLLATYQATNGKRIAFKANWRSDGSIRAEVAHFSAETTRVVPLLARSRIDGQQKSILRLADFDVMSELNNGVFARRAPTGQLDATAKFMASDEGTAYAEGVHALYVALDEIEDVEVKLSDLYSMYGALLMSMQLSSNVKVSLDGSQAAVDARLLRQVRAACVGLACNAAGRKFVVHPDGQFDILTRISEIKPTNKSANAGGESKPLTSSPNSPFHSFKKNGDGTCTNPFDANPCFGKCGPGCFNPGDITTIECAGHDLCVCKWGHAACAFSVPTSGAGCDGCHTLIEAAWSFVAAFFSQFGSDPPENPFDGPDSGAYWQGW